MAERELVRKARIPESPRDNLVMTLSHTLSLQHPQKRVTASEIGRHLGVTRERARQILKEIQGKNPQLPVEKPGERIALAQLAGRLRTTAKRLLELLSQGRISLGDKFLDDFVLSLPPGNRTQKKFILPQNLDLAKILKEI